MAEPIISVSGLRGIVGQSLDPEVVTRYIAAFAASLPDGAVVVTYDGRTTGPMIVDAVRATLAAAGRQVLDAGPAATPTTGVLVTSLGAAGAVQVSASHNPPEYNGLKLFNDAGRVIPAAHGRRVLDAYRRGVSASIWKSHDGIGGAERVSDPCQAHLDRLLKICDVDAIRRRKFRVLLDSNHGAGAVAGQPLLEALGCDVTVLGSEPSGHFAHPAEPTEQNLETVRAEVTGRHADIGFCQDPDADRLAIIDESGRYVGEEYTLAICVDHQLRRQRGPIVANCSTSRMSEDLAGKYDVPYVRAQVGEANVVDAMLAHEAVLGGEGNGGVIDPRVGWVRDSLAGMALVLDALAARGLTASELVDELPRYAIHKTKIPLADRDVASILDALPARFPNAAIDRMDGLRLDWPRRWLLVRASNTEPIVRAIAEAPTLEEAEQLCQAAAEVAG